MPSSERIKVGLIDDSDIIRESVQFAFEHTSNLTLAYYCRDGQLALGQLQKVQADFLVIDLFMPGLDGLSVAQFALQLKRSWRVIIFSGFNMKAYVAKAREIGAAAFIIKDRMDDLVSAIRRLKRDPRLPFLDMSVQNSKPIKLPSVKTTYQPQYPKSRLSPRECEILRLWTSGLEVKEIATELGLRATTVRSHRAAIIRKTHTRSLADITRLAISLQLIDP